MLARLTPFHWTLLLTAAARLVLAAWLPMTGDEAYYVSWGRHPALGYYDQPPMTGWWLAALLLVSDARLWLRLPVVALGVVMPLGLRHLLRTRALAPGENATDRDRNADLAAMLFLLAPQYTLLPLISTDVTLILFAGACVFFLVLAHRRASLAAYAAAGVALGLAFLSKYLALLVPAGYGTYLGLSTFFGARRTHQAHRWMGFALTLACAAPAIALHVAWNLENCWATFNFHLVIRHGRDPVSLETFAIYLGSQLYLATPFLLVALARARGHWRDAGGEAALAACFFLVPLTALGVTALKYPQLPHWTLAFYPAFYLLLGTVLAPAQLRWGVRWMAAFLALNALALVVYVAGPDSVEFGPSERANRMLFLHADELVAAIEPYAPGTAAIAASDYTGASIIGYAMGRDVSVLGTGARFGRHDDWITDFRRLDGKDILYVVRLPSRPDRWAQDFTSVEARSIEVRGVTYHVTVGRGFKYASYRDRVLSRIRERYYTFPRRMEPAACPFTDRYFR